MYTPSSGGVNPLAKNTNTAATKDRNTTRFDLRKISRPKVNKGNNINKLFENISGYTSGFTMFPSTCVRVRAFQIEDGLSLVIVSINRPNGRPSQEVMASAKITGKKKNAESRKTTGGKRKRG